MATVIPGFGTAQASAQAILRAPAVGTTSYVATNDAPTLGFSCCRFGLPYTNGDETSYQFYAEGYDGTTWHVLTFKATQASAVSELTPDVLNITKETISTFAGAATLCNLGTSRFDCAGYQKVRGQLKSTGGTPTGTIGVTVSFGMDVVNR